ncbi:hypothetical protein [Streptomyces sp. NBC_00557]|uniref:hypothetical protein n=1 Tax=Streptomyces sp. NBC_00557 TaxID=2975776 RepID=UPI002E822154|nr:hypothetical protein [Streptomyces sp. NBC_00557]WUC32981.1 hypothetical protein OG956_01505 [Streptomyces sp. NBC_00557]
MSAGRRRLVLLLVTLGTFAAALTGLYALTGIWLTRDAADRWAIAIAFAVAASGAADKALSPWAAQAPHDASADRGNGRPAASTAPSSTDPPGRRDTDTDGARPDPSMTSRDPASPPPEPPGGRRWPTRERVTTALVSAAVTAAVCAVVYGALAPGTGHARAASTTTASRARPSGTGTTTPAPHGYTLVYRHRTLALKNYTFYFDLRAGAVSGSETAWSVSTDAGGDGNGAFELQPLTDAYVAPGRSVPTAAQCAGEATDRPAHGWLHFRQVPPGTTFCLRDTTTGDIAVLTVIDVDHGDYATTDDITYYRRHR